MYGNSTRNTPYVKKHIGADGKEASLELAPGYLNDYPECNCINSQFIRTDASIADDSTVGKMSAKRLTSYQASVAQQKQDLNCSDAPFNSYVDSVVKENISFCLNVCNKCKALAIDNSKVSIKQECKATINDASNSQVDQPTKAAAMDDEDEKEEEEQRKKEREANKKMVNEAKEKLLEQQALADKLKKRKRRI